MDQRQITRLSPMLRIMAWRLVEGHVVSKDELIQAVYGGHEDGGPDDALGSINVSMCYLRLALAPSGVEIGTRWGNGWYLKTDPAALRALLADEIARNVKIRSCRVPRGKRQTTHETMGARV